MDLIALKSIVYWWFHFLNGKALHSDQDFEHFQKFFGSINEGPAEDSWQMTQLKAVNMWRSLELTEVTSQSKFLEMFHQRFCDAETCPMKSVSTLEHLEAHLFSGESPLYGLIVGPQGQLKSGDPNDFVNTIVERISPKGAIQEAFYHDPYIISSQTDGSSTSRSFAASYLEGLQNQFQPLTLVTAEMQPIGNIKVPVKRIPKHRIHDRYIVILDAEKWKGVAIGASINGFPFSDDSCKASLRAHFVISKLEEADAQGIAEIIKELIQP
jgi:hypothetical protein